MPLRPGILLSVLTLSALPLGGCGEVRYTVPGDSGSPETTARDRGSESSPPDLLQADTPAACLGAPLRDGYEPNERCADPKPHFEISDKSGLELGLASTIYPSGDVDWFAVRVTESDGPGCIPFTKQCLSLEVRLKAPAGVQYQFTIYLNKCSDPTKGVTGVGSATVEWEGECMTDDSLDVWIQVQAVAGTQPACSGQPYELLLAEERKNNSGC